MSNRKYAVLIGGVPGVGKSSISGELARESGFNILLSGDYLREFYRAYIGDDNILNTSVYEAWRKYGEKNEDNVLRGFLSQAEEMSAGIRRTLERAASNGEFLVLETLYFVPSMLGDIIEKSIPLYLYFEDENDHRNSLNARTQFTHFNSPGERLSERLWEYRIMMRRSLEECRKMGIPAFEMSDYAEAREKILRHVKEKLEEY